MKNLIGPTNAPLNPLLSFQPKPADTLSPVDLNARINSFMMASVHDGSSKDELANRISKLIKENPHSANSLHFKTDQGWILSHLINPTFKKMLTADAQDPAVMKSDRENIKNGTLTYGPLQGQLFMDEISPNDIRQGADGDCYFLAALASTASSNPAFIRDSIALNADGTYTVRFFNDQNKPTYVTVDNDFPHRKSGAPLYGSNTNPNELWVAVMEKAYAKWKHGYDKINGGYTDKALHEITGLSVKNITNNKSSADGLYATLESAAAQGRPLTAVTSNDPKKYANTGLVSRHAYSVLGAKTIDGKKYVVMRNPWGHAEWNGAGADPVNDGTFTIPIEDYKKYFSQTSILKSKPVSQKVIVNKMKFLAV